MRTLAIFLMCCGCLWSQSAKPDELLVAARQVIGSGNYGRALVLVVMANQSLLKGTTSALSPTRIRAAMEQEGSVQAVQGLLDAAAQAISTGNKEEAGFRLRSATAGLARLVSHNPASDALNARQDVVSEARERGGEALSPTLHRAARAAWTVRDHRTCIDLMNRAIPQVHRLTTIVYNRYYTLLGACYLGMNDAAKATEALWQSIRKPAPGVLKSSGPNMGLATLFLERGDTQTVLAFLKEAGTLDWPGAAEKTARWLADVQQNRKPDFGMLGTF